MLTNYRYDDKIYAPVILKTATNALLTKGMVLDTLNPQVVFVFDTNYASERICSGWS
ncbi:MAG: hypothetical protein IPH61_15215 [Bacteroidetes bacterium]|nr:hypothetical protein [Bacteroidota bacterium]